MGLPRISLPFAPFVIVPSGLRQRLDRRLQRQSAFLRAKNAVIAGDFEILEEILAKEDAEFVAECRDGWTQFLEEILLHFLADAKFDESEREFVRRYVTILRISKDDAQPAYKRAAARTYQAIAFRSIRTGKLSERDKDALANLANRLGLTPSEQQASFADAVVEEFHRYTNEILADGFVSDEEYEGLQARIREFHIRVTNEDEYAEAIGLGRSRWRALYGPLAPVSVDGINLRAGEIAYFVGAAEWYELRKVRANYADFVALTSRVRIVKGLSLRAGRIAYTRPTSEKFQLIDSGTIVVTNARFIFMGQRGNKSMTWRSVLAVNILEHNQFELEKTSGKNPVVCVTASPTGDPMVAPYLVQRMVCSGAAKD